MMTRAYVGGDQAYVGCLCEERFTMDTRKLFPCFCKRSTQSQTNMRRRRSLVLKRLGRGTEPLKYVTADLWYKCECMAYRAYRNQHDYAKLWA